MTFILGLAVSAASASLEVEVVSPSPVNVCDSSSYLVYINNTGFDPESGISANITMPEDYSYDSGSTVINHPGGTSNTNPTLQGQQLLWDLGQITGSDLSPGQSIVLQFGLTASCDAQSGLRLKADVHSDADSYYGESQSIVWSGLSPLAAGSFEQIELVAHVNGQDYGNLTNVVNATGKAPFGMVVSQEAEVDAQSSAVVVTKTADPVHGAPSTNVTFVIEVKNDGDVVLDPVRVVDTLPDGLSYVSDNRSGSLNGNITTWTNLGPLGPGNSTYIELVAHIDGTVFGPLPNRVRVVARPPTGDPVSDRAVARVNALVSAIDLTTTLDPGQGAPSTNVTVVIAVANAGQVALETVVLEDQLPAGLDYVSDNRSGSLAGEVITWSDLGPLDPGESTEVELVLHINGEAYGLLNSSLQATGTPPTGDAVSDEEEDQILAQEASIRVTKVAMPAEGAPSTNVEFDILVENTGEVALDPVMVQDTLPPGLDYVSDNQSGTVDGQNVTWSGLGPLAPGQSATIQLVAHINGQVSGILNNTVRAAGQPPTGDEVEDLFEAQVDAKSAAIQVTKAADPAVASPQANITFLIQVTNAGQVPLSTLVVTDQIPAGLVYVSDNHSGSLSGDTVTWQIPGPLAPGGSELIELQVRVDGTVYGNLTNVVNVTALPPTGGQVSDSFAADVLVQRAAIEAVKAADVVEGAPSTNLTFVITVTNTGEATLDPVRVVDVLPSGLSYVSDNRSGVLNGDRVVFANLGPLGPGNQTWIEVVAHVDGDVYGVLRNRARATGTPPAGDQVTDLGVLDVTALRSGIEVTKASLDVEGAPSTNLTFVIVVENTGEVPLDPVTATDTLPVGLNYVSDNRSGTVSGNEVTWSSLGPLDPGNSTCIELVAHINGQAYGTLTNQASVTALPPTGDAVEDNDTLEITAWNAGINVTKTVAPPEGAPSTNVTFVILVENTGEVPLDPVTATDTLPVGLNYVSDNRSGTVSGNEVTWSSLGVLDPGNSTYIELVAHINGEAFGLLENTVNVSGRPPRGDAVEDMNSAQVLARNAALRLVKTATPAEGAPSTNVTFVILVENSGQVALDPVTVEDALPDGLSYVSDNRSGSVSGNSIVWSGIGPLEPGNRTWIELVAHIDGTIFGPLENTVNATGTPPTGDDVFSTTSEEVLAQRASVEVAKSADPDEGAPSTNVTFVIRVENTGEATLNTVRVVDILPPGLSYVSNNRSGTFNVDRVIFSNVGPLAAGESTFIELVAHIDGTAYGELVNRVRAVGRPVSGDEVRDVDNQTVLALRSGIEVVKTADPSEGAHSTNVTYVIRVSNTGEVPLTPVVEDVLPLGLNYVSDNRSGTVSGNEVTWSSLGALDPGNSTCIELVAHINGEAYGTLTNQASVTGTPPTGDAVEDNDSVDVIARNAAVSVAKTVAPAEGAPSTDVTFEILVNNTGEVPLDPVTVTDTLPVGLDYVSDSGSGTVDGENITWDLGQMLPGEQESIELVAHINGEAYGNLTNLVSASGAPPTGDPVEDQNSAQVRALRASLAIEQIPDPAMGAACTEVKLLIRVTNDGEVPLSELVITDQIPAGLEYVSDNQSGQVSGDQVTWEGLGPLQPGESAVIELVVRITGEVYGDLANLVTAKAMPPTGDQVSVTDLEDIRALRAEIEIAKSSYPEHGAPSTDVLFTITVTNSGDVPLAPEVTDTLPLGLDYLSDDRNGTVSGSTITWSDLGTVLPGEPLVIELIGHINGEAYGNLTNLVEVTGIPPTGCHVQAETSDSVLAERAILKVVKSASPRDVVTPARITFTIQVENGGDATLSPVTVEDRLPEGMAYVSSTPEAAVSGNLLTWDLGTMAAGDQATLTVVADVGEEVSGTLINEVTGTGLPIHGDPVTTFTATAVKAVRRERTTALEEPLQYEQYCESRKIAGSGDIDVGTSIIDKRIALEYSNFLAGEGDFEMDSEHVLSENASKLQREVVNKTMPLNFFETSKMTFSGATPLVGEKRLSSRELYGGIGADVREMFAVKEIESEQTTFFASTDPISHITNGTVAEQLRNASPTHLVGLETANRFNGTWGTETRWHKIMHKDIQDRQIFSGDFEAEKLIKLHESPIPEPWSPPCKGVDC